MYSYTQKSSMDPYHLVIMFSVTLVQFRIQMLYLAYLIAMHRSMIIELFNPFSVGIPKRKNKRFMMTRFPCFWCVFSHEVWDGVFSFMDVNDKIDCIISTVHHYFKLSFPIRRTTILTKKYFTKVKFDQSLINMHLFDFTRDFEQAYLDLKKRYREISKISKGGI